MGLIGEARSLPLLRGFVAKLDVNEWDIDAWLALIATVGDSSRKDISVGVARDIFDSAAVQFPTTAKVWVSWIKYEQGVLSECAKAAGDSRARARAPAKTTSRRKRTLSELESQEADSQSGDFSNATSDQRSAYVGVTQDGEAALWKAENRVGPLRAAESILADDDFEDPREVYIRRLQEKDEYETKIKALEAAKSAQAASNNNNNASGGANQAEEEEAEKPPAPKPTDYIVLKIFNKALRSCMSIELARLYISYLNVRFPQRGEDGATISANRATLIQAYEFIIMSMGCDVNSGIVWQMYIKFVKNAFADTEQQPQRMELLRQIYHRAIWTPLNNIEQLWQDYDNFENGLNKITAKKFITDKSSGYMTARASLRELNSYLELINRVRRVWIAHKPTWSDKEMMLIREWKKYLAYEISNPLGYEDDSLVYQRVAYAFRSALGMLRFFPEMWHMYSRYLISINKPKQAIQILQSASKALPNSLLIAFNLAEVYEVQKQPVTEIYNIFDSLLMNLAKEKRDINLKYDYWMNKMLKLYEKVFGTDKKVKKEDKKKKTTTQTTTLSADEIIAMGEESLNLPLFADAQLNSLMNQLDQGIQTWATEVTEDDDDEWDGEKREKERERRKQFEKMIGGVIEAKRKTELDDVRNCMGLVWVVYMRSVRRIRDINSARQIFKIARKREERFGGECPYQVWVCAALMEYHITKDAKVAARIFEYALTAFDLSEDKHGEDLVLQYLDFLISLNNDTNTRALFERTLAILPPRNARRVWDRFLNYELQFGDLQSFLSVEKRMRKVYKEESDEIKSKMTSRVGRNTNANLSANAAASADDRNILEIYSDRQDINQLKEVAGRWESMQDSVIAERELGISKHDQFVRKFEEEHQAIDEKNEEAKNAKGKSGKGSKNSKSKNKGANGTGLAQYGLYDVGVNNSIISASQPGSSMDENFIGLSIYGNLVESTGESLILHTFASRENQGVAFGKSGDGTIDPSNITGSVAAAAAAAAADPAAYNPRKLQSLTSVTPDKFPRPDFRKWANYKPESPANDGMMMGTMSGNMMPAEAVLRSLASDSGFARVFDAIGPSMNYNGPVVDPNTVVSLLQGINLQRP